MEKELTAPEGRRMYRVQRAWISRALEQDLRCTLKMSRAVRLSPIAKNTFARTLGLCNKTKTPCRCFWGKRD